MEICSFRVILIIVDVIRETLNQCRFTRSHAPTNNANELLSHKLKMIHQIKCNKYLNSVVVSNDHQFSSRVTNLFFDVDGINITNFVKLGLSVGN